MDSMRYLPIYKFYIKNWYDSLIVVEFVIWFIWTSNYQYAIWKKKSEIRFQNIPNNLMNNECQKLNMNVHQELGSYALMIWDIYEK